MQKTKNNLLFKTFVAIVLLLLLFAIIIIIKKLQYIQYPEFTQQIRKTLDQYEISHDKEIVLDFREMPDNTYENKTTFEGVVFESTYKIKGTNITIKTNAVTDEYGIATSDGPSEVEILKKLEELRS